MFFNGVGVADGVIYEDIDGLGDGGRQFWVTRMCFPPRVCSVWHILRFQRAVQGQRDVPLLNGRSHGQTHGKEVPLELPKLGGHCSSLNMWCVHRILIKSTDDVHRGQHRLPRDFIEDGGYARERETIAYHQIV